MRLQKEELATLTLLAFAAVAIGLFVFVALPQSDSELIVGHQATIQGTLLHKEQTYKGSHWLLTVKTDDQLVTVFVSSSSNCYGAAGEAVPGEALSVSGKVQEYEGTIELVAESITPA